VQAVRIKAFWLFFIVLFGGFSLAFFLVVHRSVQDAYAAARIAEPATVCFVEAYWMPMHILLLLFGWGMLRRLPHELRYMIALAMAISVYFVLLVVYLIGVDVMHMPPLVTRQGHAPF
jgi:hypothetical protein